MLYKNASVIYSNEFYAGQVDGSASSAAVVVPIVLSLLPVKTVVDVGCGVGSWAAEFLANGVPDVSGIDGDYVDRSKLQIPVARFFARDLTKSLKLDRTFDLAVCLEVGEHLPESRGRGLVVDLTSLAPCILFSAAVPGQGGTHHINEQYLSYWIDLFKDEGYEGIDLIRPRILGNDSVEWFYQQNTVMFVAQKHPLLGKDFAKPQTIIHQNLYERARNPSLLPLRKLLGAFSVAVRRSIRYHLGLPVRAHDRGC